MTTDKPPEHSCSPAVKVVVKEEYDRGSIDGYMDFEEAVDSGYEEEDLVKIVLL